MKILIILAITAILAVVISCNTSQSQEAKPSEPQLQRISYQSAATGKERDYYVYLPAGYEENTSKKYPVMLFLHGGGERGNAKEDLKRVIVNGPLYEAWIQKRDLPFIIIAPQLPLFDLDIPYLTPLDKVPERQENGTPKRPEKWAADTLMTGTIPAEELPFDKTGLPKGWGEIKEELMAMVVKTLEDYRTDEKRVYLTGLSYGGFGTWIMASHYPDRFAAIAPVVGWGHPDLMPPIAEAKIPVWCISGGRDAVVQNTYFFKGMNTLESLGHTNIRFTVHEDMRHDVWTRVYAGDDLYNWLLEHELEE